MAARLPVIVSDQVGAAHDLVEGKETGFVFKWNDVDDLQRKMCAMYENRDMCKRFATNASKLMHEYWNYDLYRNCLVDFLDYATNKKSY
jgi:glycosyltransferase involved in cell wall biosynthesis